MGLIVKRGSQMALRLRPAYAASGISSPFSR
jgi:hypothetical protein